MSEICFLIFFYVEQRGALHLKLPLLSPLLLHWAGIVFTEHMIFCLPASHHMNVALERASSQAEATWHWEEGWMNDINTAEVPLLGV